MSDGSGAKMARADEPWRSLSAFLHGRVGRIEYWLWVAAFFAGSTALAYIHALNLGFNLAFKLGVMLQQSRRLHVFDRSGWWAVLFVVIPFVVGHLLELVVMRSTANTISTFVGLAIIAFVGGVPGNHSSNRFGAPPASDLRGIFFKP
jgi:uncharacterized membrane protein YhaH (DUF805 family)